jgi:hypothetical protein
MILCKVDRILLNINNMYRKIFSVIVYIKYTWKNILKKYFTLYTQFLKI